MSDRYGILEAVVGGYRVWVPVGATVVLEDGTQGRYVGTVYINRDLLCVVEVPGGVVTQDGAATHRVVHGSRLQAKEER